MTYVEFVRERQEARYAVGKGRFRAAAKHSKWSRRTASNRGERLLVDLRSEVSLPLRLEGAQDVIGMILGSTKSSI